MRSAERPAVVFDLDGTLVHSLPGLLAATNAELGRHGRRPLSEAVLRRMVGDGAGTLVDRAFRATGGPPPSRALADWLERYESEAKRGSSLFPGAAEVLAALRPAWRIGLCTNKPDRATHAILAAFGIANAFDAVVGGDLAPARKPDPAHLAAVVGALGGGPAIVVGDSPIDLAAGRAFGAPVVLVRWGYSRVPVGSLGADAVIEGFEQLEAVVGGLLRRR